MKILLPLMSLGIGGAETHVLTLALELKRRGYNPVVVSAGGIYVKELEKNGIKHYKLPLSSKNPMNLIYSTKNLLEIIKIEEIDIIHSHGRIPSLVAKIASVIKKKHFLTTVHAVYKLNSYKWLSCFGEKTICVSEDIKNHIINNYNVNEKKIVIIPNGIDLSKFNPYLNIENLDIYDKYSENSIKISYISRMENGLAKMAVRVGKLLSEYANDKNIMIEYLLIGDGKNFNYVVEEMDKLIKDKKNIRIKILGKRTDIPELIKYSDFTVCVSRVALESMACGKPVIILGGEGYEGLLTEENFTMAESSNFTGRDSLKTFTNDKFISDVDYLIGENDADNIQKLGNFLHEKITNKYSVDMVVEKTLEVYLDLIGGK